MPSIRPFRGVLYDPSVVGPLGEVVAPPYDVIGAGEQSALYEASPYNVVRLDLAREPDRYAAAVATWRDWRASGALKRDREAALYAYVQRYPLKSGEERERWGFFARLHLEDFASGRVRPHEKTLAGPKADRLALQRACRANLSAIFGLYSAPGRCVRETLGAAAAAPPLAEFADRASVRHRFWRVTDAAIVSAFARTLAERTVYVADGHHRYETALRYRDEMRAATGRRGGEEPFDWVLAFLVNMDEPGLVVLPTHRMLRALPMPPREIVERLRAWFSVEELPKNGGGASLVAALRRVGAGERRIGLALRGADRHFVLSTRDGANDARLTGSITLRRLDVTLLHGLVLEGPASLLRLDAHAEAEAGRLVYTKDEGEVVERVASGEFAASFLLNATRVDEVRAVCDAGETMPEKSTYFHPKIPTGLVFNDLEED